MKFKGNPLWLEDEPVLVEQLRLLFLGARNTFLTVNCLIFCMNWVLLDDSNARALIIWSAIAAVSNLNFYRFSRKHLALGMPLDQAHRMVWVSVGLSILGGAIWGSLAWVTLGNIGVWESLFVLVMLSATASGAAYSYSPVLPVCFAFVISMCVTTATALWQMGGTIFHTLATACLVSMVTLIAQARSGSKVIQTSIQLRFEKKDLLDKLRLETNLTDAARLRAEQAHREAEHANAAKSKFLAAASHDLRQPIHAQGLFLKVLSRTQLDATQRQLLNSVNAAADASAEMLNTLLDFSRIDAGVIDPLVTTFRVQAVLNKIEREFGQQADAKGLSYRSRESSLVVQSDPALVELILRNLVSNAIRYTEHGGLLVTCRLRGAQAMLEVWDTGIGIPQAQQQDVFLEFHQLGNPQRDRRNGLGLGLAIAQGLARTLGHQLTLKSTLHRGSRFQLTLPIASLALTEYVSTTESGLTQLLNVRILVVEDDEAVLLGMLHLLRDWGCQCEGAADLDEALALVQGFAPQVIVSDHRLREERTGVQVIAAARAVLGVNLPALLITGDTAPERLREALASGITLLHKPLAPHHLYSALVAELKL